jgi:uncharacterized protein DUF6390
MDTLTLPRGRPPTTATATAATSTAAAHAPALAGAQLFIRYAYPPNSLGYCGPADSAAFFQYGASGTVDRGLVQLARSFEGAWPYLELIAGATGIGDPLDRRVVEAYWVGNCLLPAVGVGATAASVEERFRPRTGRRFPHLLDAVLAGGVPHHSFHVFGVYPWVGLLGDDRKAPHALNVLDRCRIRWGRVEHVDGDQVTVTSRPLTWNGEVLGFGDPRPEVALHARDAVGYLAGLQPGDCVSLHWDWVCDRLSPRQLRLLRGYTLRQLEITNHSLPRGTSGSAIAEALQA